MTTLIKKVLVSELPIGWRADLGLNDGDLVRIEIQKLLPPAELDVTERSLRRLHAISPAPARIDAVELIRAERDRIDGRGQ